MGGLDALGTPKVLVLNWRDLRNPLAGGGEVHVWRVFQHALQCGWEVRAICSGFPGAAREENVDGIDVIRCGTELTYPACVPFAYQRVRRKFSPDFVFEVMDKLPLMTPLYVREPTVCFLHHFFGDAAPLEVSWPVAWTVKAAERAVPYVYPGMHFMTGSASATDELVRLGVNADRVDTLSYGVDMDQLGPTAKTPWPSIVYVGRLRRYKHVDHLLRAAARIKRQLPELRVDIVGDGDAESDLRALAQSLGMESCVTFHGHVTDFAKRVVLGRSWAACLPSRKEGFGLSIPEAALCGTPTVGYDVPGVCDAIEHGVTGLLAPYGDVGALGRALGQMLHNDLHRKQLAAQARRRYSDFTWENATRQTLSAVADWFGERAGARERVLAGEKIRHAGGEA